MSVCILNICYILPSVQTGDPQEVCTAEKHQIQSSRVWEEGVDQGEGEKTHIQTQKCKVETVLLRTSLVIVLHCGCFSLTPVSVCDLFPQPIKAPESVATVITSESVFYKVQSWLFLVSKTNPNLCFHCILIITNYFWFYYFINSDQFASSFGVNSTFNIFSIALKLCSAVVIHCIL